MFSKIYTTKQDCNIQSCDERTTSMWTECTVTCGGGKQLRNNNGKTEVKVSDLKVSILFALFKRWC